MVMIGPSVAPGSPAPGGSGGGSVSEITSTSGTITVTSPTGPTVNVEVHQPVYASLSGAGEGSSPGALTQDGALSVEGDLTVNATSLPTVSFTTAGGNLIMSGPDGTFFNGEEMTLFMSSLIEVDVPGVLCDYFESSIQQRTIWESSPGVFHLAAVDFTADSGSPPPFSAAIISLLTSADGAVWIQPTTDWVTGTTDTPGKVSFFGVTPVAAQVSGGTTAGVIAGLVALGLFSS